MTNGILCTLNCPRPENHSADGNFQGLFSQLRKFCGLGTPTPRPPTPTAVQRTPPQTARLLDSAGRVPASRRVLRGCALRCGAAERRVLAPCPPSVPPPAAAAAPRFIARRPARAGAFP